MKVIRMDLNEIEQLEDLAACIGYFDGMHVGHMRLIEKTLEQADKKGLKSACITFDPDPWCVIKRWKSVSKSDVSADWIIGSSFPLQSNWHLYRIVILKKCWIR